MTVSHPLPPPALADRFVAFAAAVQRTFAALPGAGRWTLERIGWPEVEYRTSATRLTFALAEASHGEGRIVELYATPTRPGAETVDLGDLQEWASPGLSAAELVAEVGRARFRADDEAATVASVSRVGELLGGRFAALLTDDAATLDAVARTDRERGLATARSEVSGRADDAFRREDWAAVVRRLEPYEDGLQRSDELKLAYARRRL